MTETKPIHLSLFEAIKVAVASEESTEADEEKPELDVKAPIKEAIQHKEPKTTSTFSSCINFLSGAFSWLPRQYQMLSGVVFFGAIWAWSRSGANGNQQIAELNQKVDQLSSELAEIKALLNTVVHSMDKNDIRSEL